MNTVPFDAALFAVIAIAALAFCLGFVVASVMNMRPARHAQAAPPTVVRIAATGRPSRWPAVPTNSTGPDSRPRCACGYLRCICAGSAPR